VNFVKLLPVMVSSLVLVAHFMRDGSDIRMVMSLLIPFLLLAYERWAARVVQLFLVIGAVEWARTTAVLLAERVEEGRPFMRMLIILASVTVFTAASAFVFRLRSLKELYGLSDAPEGECGEPTEAGEGDGAAKA
jgi:hypothetical protein